ncbi:hypothetical protein Dimus_011461 [Dionaea muscipula]
MEQPLMRFVRKVILWAVLSHALLGMGLVRLSLTSWKEAVLSHGILSLPATKSFEIGSKWPCRRNRILGRGIKKRQNSLHEVAMILVLVAPPSCANGGSSGGYCAGGSTYGTLCTK